MPDVQKTHSQMEEIIRIEEVEKRYNVGEITIRALDKVSLNVARNEYVAIMGPSGSGKSTLMNIIGCLDTPDSGTYLLAGEDVGMMDDDALAAIRNRQIGFVFQAFNLLAGRSALDNVALPLLYAGVRRREREERAAYLLEKVGLKERMMHTPAELSGGQKQRVALARALACNPPIILADEPTGNLDTATSIEIMSLLDQIHSEGGTVILVTHEDDIASYARRIIRLRDGKIHSDTKKNY